MSPVRWHLTLENLQQWNIASNPRKSRVINDGSTTEEKVSFINNALRHVILEWELFPKSFNLRLGYNFRRAEEYAFLNSAIFLGFHLVWQNE
jgi:hypothetical protein